MAGSPKKRARRELAQAHGELTTPENVSVAVLQRGKRTTPLVTKTGEIDRRQLNKGQSAERMRELVEIRRQKAAQGDKEALGGRPRTKFTRAQITERVLERLEPKALKVLEQQINDPDLDPSDRRAAAIKVLEYRRGKPTQALKVDQQQVTTIRFETAAWIPGMENASAASLETGEILELEAAEIADSED